MRYIRFQGKLITITTHPVKHTKLFLPFRSLHFRWEGLISEKYIKLGLGISYCEAMLHFLVLGCNLLPPSGQSAILEMLKCNGEENNFPKVWISGAISTYMREQIMYIASGRIISDEMHSPFKLTSNQVSIRCSESRSLQGPIISPVSHYRHSPCVKT